MIEIPSHLLEKKEPFFVCSKSILEKQIAKLRHLGAKVNYSVKTNHEPVVLKTLHEMGTGFSVSSPEEYMLALSVGASPEKIIYYERGITLERAKWLARMGCSNFVVDSKAAFENIKPIIGDKSSILFRIKSDSAENKYSGKYVAGMESDEIKTLLTGCKCKTGILHHTSSQVEDISTWNRKFEELAKWDVDVINIGGGIPISYEGGEYSQIIDSIKSGVKKLKAKQIIVEPGRFIVGPACSLIAKVDLVDEENAILNCSVYNVHIDTIIADLVLPCRGVKKGEEKEYRLLGSSLCNLDIFNQKAKLPKLSAGDSVIFDNAGAYNFSSQFSSGSGIETYIID